MGQKMVKTQRSAGLAQLVRALDCGSSGFPIFSSTSPANRQWITASDAISCKPPRATIRLDDADLDALRGVDAKPTKRAPGHWRCAFWVRPGSIKLPAPCIPLPGDEWVFPIKWPSQESADESGLVADRANRLAGYGDDIRYVRAEYFPEYA